MSPPSTIEAARDYLARDWQPVAIPRVGGAPSKGPRVQGWQHTRYTPEGLAAAFGADENIGLILGAASRGLVDVDLDCPEAIALASAYLPATERTHGRPGTSPEAHYWYVVDDPPRATVRYRDPVDAATLVELRSGSDEAASQTVVPPSIHPCGEPIAWSREGEPARVPIADLQRCVALVASAALLVRHYPAHGSRHDHALALAGMLLTSGYDEDEVSDLITRIATHGGSDDPRARAAVVASTARRIRAGQPVTGRARLAEIIGDKIVRQVCTWLALARAAAPAGAGEKRGPVAPTDAGEKRSPADRLVELARASWTLGHDRSGVAYAIRGMVAHRVTSAAYRAALADAYWRAHERAPSIDALRTASTTIEAIARHDGPERQVALRVGGDDVTTYLDLGHDAPGRCVEVTRDGWRVIEDAPVAFRRGGGALPLPDPERGGDIDELRALLTVDDDASWALLLGYLIGALRPRGPYPILILGGEQGAAKSTTASILRGLVDPHAAPLRSRPGDERSLAIAAEHSWIVALDNLTRLPQDMSDALCRMATGGGLGVRTLYSDRDEEVFDGTRPVVLTAIGSVATRPDLLDRSLQVTLPTIPRERRRLERDVLASSEAARPRILGALLDAIACGIRRHPEVRLDRPPRLADHAHFFCAAAPALGLTEQQALSALREASEESTATALDSSPVAVALQAWITRPAHIGVARPGARITAAQLLTALSQEDVRRTSDVWPRGPAGLTNELRRLAPALRVIGIEVTTGRGHHGWRWICVAPTATAGELP